MRVRPDVAGGRRSLGIRVSRMRFDRGNAQGPIQTSELVAAAGTRVVGHRRHSSCVCRHRGLELATLTLCAFHSLVLAIPRAVSCMYGGLHRLPARCARASEFRTASPVSGSGLCREYRVQHRFGFRLGDVYGVSVFRVVKNGVPWAAVLLEPWPGIITSSLQMQSRLGLSPPAVVGLSAKSQPHHAIPA